MCLYRCLSTIEYKFFVATIIDSILFLRVKYQVYPYKEINKDVILPGKKEGKTEKMGSSQSVSEKSIHEFVVKVNSHLLSFYIYCCYCCCSSSSS